MSKPSITDKQLLRLSKADVQLGRPVAWNIYDEAGELLLSEGSVFNSQKQLAAMLEHGAYRKNRSSTPDLEKLREEEAKDRLAEANVRPKTIAHCTKFHSRLATLCSYSRSMISATLNV